MSCAEDGVGSGVAETEATAAVVAEGSEAPALTGNNAKRALTRRGKDGRTAFTRWAQSQGAAGERLPGLLELNGAMLDLLAVWREEVGSVATAAEFGLSEAGVRAAVDWSKSPKDRHQIAAEPFAFVTVDPMTRPIQRTALEGFASPPPEGLPVGDPPLKDLSLLLGNAERFRQLALVQAMLIACLTNLAAINKGLPALLFAANPLQETACREAVDHGLVWLQVRRRWIVATALFDRRSRSRYWGYRERYAAMTAVLRDGAS